MTLFEHLNMKGKIENELDIYLDTKDKLKVATTSFKVTYFMQSHHLERSILEALYEECQSIFGDIITLKENQILFDDKNSKIRDESLVSRIKYYQLYLDIKCYGRSVYFSIQDCTTIPVAYITINNVEDDYIREHFKDKVENDFIEGIIKISNMVKNYDKILKIYDRD